MNNANYETIRIKELTNALTTVLDCGYADINFLFEQVTDFDVSFDEAWKVAQKHDGCSENGYQRILDINSILYTLYTLSFNKAMTEVVEDANMPDSSDVDYIMSELEDAYEISVNSIASSLSIKVEDEYIRVTDYQELKEALADALKKLCEKFNVEGE